MVKLNINWLEIYEQYQKGKSLRELAKELNIRHSTVRVNFKKLKLDRRTLSEAQTGERNHEWKDGSCSKKGRVYVRLDGPKVAKARAVYMKFHNLTEIPKGYIIHHIDHDRTNDNIENLEMIENSEHMKHHKPWLETEQMKNFK